MKPGPSELGSRREGTGNTGDRLVSGLEVGRHIRLVPTWVRLHPGS